MADPKEQPSYFLKDLKPNQKRVNCIFIVLELVPKRLIPLHIGSITRTKDGNEVRTAKVADRTGTINLSVWNENCSLISPCDVLQLTQGNTTVRGGCLTLNVGRYGQLIKMGDQDVSVVTHLCRLLLVQLQKDHAQVRLSVISLFANLAEPVSIASRVSQSVKFDVVLSVCRAMRDRLLINMQEWASLALGVGLDARPLPKPVEVAAQLQQRFLNLLLDWEAEFQDGQFRLDTHSTLSSGPSALGSQDNSWRPCMLARGQFRNFLSYLRCSSSSGQPRSISTGAELIRVRELFYRLSDTRAREQQRIECGMPVNQRRSCIKYVAERIEENLTALTSLLELLVPDPFHSDSSVRESDVSCGADGEIGKKPAADDGVWHSRAHGRLFGSTSGFGFGAREIELRFPCVSNATDPAFAHICIPITRTDDVRVLEDSAREHANIVRKKYKPMLLNWLKHFRSADSSPVDAHLRDEINSLLPRIRAWLYRADRLTHLFFDRLVFVDPTGDLCPSGVVNKASGGTSDSSDTSDLEDVEPTPSNVSSCTEPFSTNSKANVLPTDGHNSASQSDSSASFGVDSRVTDSKWQVPTSGVTPVSDSPIRNLEPTRPVSDISKSLFNVLPDKSTVVWRVDEPAHPFWLPMNPEEYEAPVDYMADAICSSVTTVEHLQKTPSAMERSQDDSSILEAVNPNAPSDGSNTRGTTSNELACWAPLLSGRLCPRRDPGGRCPIHGRIVRRDKVSGRPVDPKDREVLHAEITKSQREKSEARAAEAKRQARRRYPGLVDLNKRSVTARTRLLSRVFSRQALQRMTRALDVQDHTVVDNFVHTTNTE
ncbi:hypothetical protein P879_05180 [Paragonimus westermani]|uniref:UV-stimulated scaffold protein A C-terminal domain-containing protein n=1 Tax=Paragonimus westermani TaxID=34504 RepID=A0A8T0DJD8_9TREM|nr:hypothetical protein P879_05180 [Paragonimus westermani]